MYYPEGYFTHSPPAAQGLDGAAGPLQTWVRRRVLESGSRPHQHSMEVRGLPGRVLHAVAFVRRRALFGLVDELGPPRGADRCLEIGPGTGDDMWRISQLGWTVTGIDLDPEAAEVAAERSGCDVIVGSVLDHHPPEPYGLVYSSHSLEHVPDLRETVIHLRSLLTGGGRLVAVIPNPQSLSARLNGPLSVVWDPPRHLSLPSAQALRSLLAEAGFHGVKVRTTARRAGHYCAVARARRLGATGTGAWNTPANLASRSLHATAALMVRLGMDVGEETIVSAVAS